MDICYISMVLSMIYEYMLYIYGFNYDLWKLCSIGIADLLS